MARDPLARMDIDTRWAYHRKLRRLQRLHPEKWPTYWSAYLALLGEAWAAGRRSLTLEQTWVPAMPCTHDEALAALIESEIVDRQGRVPQDSWKEWYEPVATRLKGRSGAGSRAAHERWHTGVYEECERCASAMRTHSPRNAPRPPSTPSTPATPRAREGARGATGHKTEGNGDAEAIARARARLDDPKTPTSIREVAKAELDRLGVGYEAPSKPLGLEGAGA